MAFVNERMTKEEQAEFAAKEIPNPGNRFFILRPYRWTIDREENVFLVRGLQEREEPHDYYFLLGWKGTPIPVKLSKKWVDEDTCKWGLIYIKIPEDLGEMRSEIIQSLKDALSVYGFNGVPDDPLNKDTKVQFSF